MTSIDARRFLTLILASTLLLGLFAFLGGQAQAAQNAPTDTPTPELTSSPQPPTATQPPTVVSTRIARPSASPNPSASPALSATMTVTGSTGTDVWTLPINLSQSGAASQAVIAAEPNGSLDLLWWDKFEGTKYAFFSADKGWSKPQAVPTIIGGRPLKFGEPLGTWPSTVREQCTWHTSGRTTPPCSRPGCTTGCPATGGFLGKTPG
jgi:hypothetical protein